MYTHAWTLFLVAVQVLCCSTCVLPKVTIRPLAVACSRSSVVHQLLLACVLFCACGGDLELFYAAYSAAVCCTLLLRNSVSRRFFKQTWALVFLAAKTLCASACFLPWVALRRLVGALAMAYTRCSISPELKSFCNVFFACGGDMSPLYTAVHAAPLYIAFSAFRAACCATFCCGVFFACMPGMAVIPSVIMAWGWCVPGRRSCRSPRISCILRPVFVLSMSTLITPAAAALHFRRPSQYGSGFMAVHNMQMSVVTAAVTAAATVLYLTAVTCDTAAVVFEVPWNQMFSGFTTEPAPSSPPPNQQHDFPVSQQDINNPSLEPHPEPPHLPSKEGSVIATAAYAVYDLAAVAFGFPSRPLFPPPPIEPNPSGPRTAPAQSQCLRRRRSNKNSVLPPPHSPDVPHPKHHHSCKFCAKSSATAKPPSAYSTPLLFPKWPPHTSPSPAPPPSMPSTAAPLSPLAHNIPWGELPHAFVAGVAQDDQRVCNFCYQPTYLFSFHRYHAAQQCQHVAPPTALPHQGEIARGDRWIQSIEVPHRNRC